MESMPPPWLARLERLVRSAIIAVARTAALVACCNLRSEGILGDERVDLYQAEIPTTRTPMEWRAPVDACRVGWVMQWRAM